MPRVSEHQKLLNALSTAKEKLEIAVYLKILQDAILDAESPSPHDTDSSDNPSSSIMPSPSTPESSSSDLNNLSAISSDLSGPLDLTMIGLLSSHGMIEALEDEVTQAHVLQSHPPSIRIPQLALLDEWQLHNPELFQHKLRVSPPVFTHIVQLIENNPVFHNNSNNPQLPVGTQLAIFLNAAGHC